MIENLKCKYRHILMVEDRFSNITSICKNPKLIKKYAYFSKYLKITNPLVCLDCLEREYDEKDFKKEINGGKNAKKR